MEYSVAVRNAQNDQLETTIGTTPSLRIFNGTKPANCAAADAGTLLATGALPSDWLTASSAGEKTRNGSWTLTGQSGAGAGTAGTYWRINQGATCHMQGTFGVGQEMVPDNNSIANGQTVTISTFSVTRGNA
jgi:hypothetical protein